MLPSSEGIRRLGLLGGTFDPIHRGHLALAEYAWYWLTLDRVWFIPSASPPHKRSRTMAPADVRPEMTRAAVMPFAPRFVAVDIELTRAGPSYTARTLQQIRSHVAPDAELYWIIGRDNVGDIPKWHMPEEIARLATLVAGGRPGSRVPDDLPQWLSSRLVNLDGPDVPVSSTHIRDQIARGVLDKDAIPEAVAQIIAREGLYGYRP